jgi:hypothetical protein
MGFNLLSLCSYVKGIYLEDIAKMAPNYLTEEFNGITAYLKEDELKQGTCPVKIEFSPFHNEQPGLRIFYSYKNLVSYKLKPNF